VYLKEEMTPQVIPYKKITAVTKGKGKFIPERKNRENSVRRVGRFSLMRPCWVVVTIIT
jgi:hypothetical protein